MTQDIPMTDETQLRDIYEVSNQLLGYVDDKTPQGLADFLTREGNEAAKLADEIVRLRALAPAPEPWTRDDLARGLARLDGVTLKDIGATVGPENDANNWREYLGRADDLLADLSASVPGEVEPVAISEIQIKHMVDRFLRWRLPENFNPDGGISFQATYNDSPAAMALLGLDKPMKAEPVGTNLFDATQATAMVRYMTEGMRAILGSLVHPQTTSAIRSLPYVTWRKLPSPPRQHQHSRRDGSR